MIYGVGGRHLNGIKSMYNDSEACVRMKESKVIGLILIAE